MSLANCLWLCAIAQTLRHPLHFCSRFHLCKCLLLYFNDSGAHVAGFPVKKVGKERTSGDGWKGTGKKRSSVGSTTGARRRACGAQLGLHWVHAESGECPHVECLALNITAV